MRKIIFSRKGFDSASGGVPSPIYPDRRMLSLPIPDKQSPIRYQDINWNEYNLGTIVSDLTNDRIHSTYGAHLDPDLNPGSLKRHEAWKPILGQTKASQGHLRNQQVQAGDIFIFYGLFRKIVINGHLKFDHKDPPAHVIWGWLQIDKIITVDSCDKRDLRWAMYHPHFHRDADKSNTVYIAKENLCMPGLDRENINGAGIFSSYHADLQLTQSESNKPSKWHLPEWLYPTDDKVPLTYHTDLKRWEKGNGYALLNTVGRGQEFVLDCQSYPEAKEWVKKILSLSL